MKIKITEIIVTPIPPTQKGIVAFVSFVIDNIYKVNNVMIGTSLKRDDLRIVYPIAILPNKAIIQVFYPINKDIGLQIENQLLEYYKNKFLDKKLENTNG